MVACSQNGKKFGIS